MSMRLQATRGALVGALLNGGFNLATGLMKARDRIGLTGLARSVGYALIVGAVTGATYAIVSARLGSKAAARATAGALAGVAFAGANILIGVSRGLPSLWLVCIAMVVSSALVGALLALVGGWKPTLVKKTYTSDRPL